MTSTGPPTNGAHFTVYLFGEFYGFADFDYPTARGVQTLTYLTLGRGYYAPMPIRAAHCFEVTILVPLLLFAVAGFLLRCRRIRRPA